MSEWKEYRLSDIANILNKKRIPLNSRERANKQGKYPYYGASGIFDYIDDYIFDGQHVLIAEDGENLRSRQTSIAFLADGKFWVNNHAHILKGNDELINEFIVYYFQCLNLNPFITGAAQPKLNLENLLSIPVFMPVREERIEITKLLNSLDRKIENLRRQNETLEAIAQTLFKHWFIDFEFPNADGKPYKSSGGAMEPSALGDIPAGWRVGELGDVIVNYDRKRIPLSSSERDLRKGSYPYYGASSVMDYIDDYIFNGTYVLMGEDGTVIDDRGFPILQYVFGKFWANNHAHVLQGKNCYSTNILYLLLKRTKINNIVTGAVQPKINQANMNSIDLVIPDEKTLLKLDPAISSIFEKIKINATHIQTLTQTRDVLLPKLMSGKLRIKD